MRHARHDAALNAAEKAVKVETDPRQLKYIVIIYDGPAVATREASFISNVDIGDVVQVCDAVAQQIKQRAN